MTTTFGPDLAARTLCVGEAFGPVIRLEAPLSLWGGIDATTGSIIEPGHPQIGACLVGAIVFIPGTHGSSGGGSVLLECLAQKTSPAAWILTAPSDILLVGALVGRELYGVRLPVVLMDPEVAGAFADGSNVRVNATGTRAVVSQARLETREPR